MNTFARFISLGRPSEVGYLAYADPMQVWSQCRNSNRPIAAWAAFFPTYGDGLVQHAAEWPVQADSLGDFCASATAYLLDHPEDVEIFAKNWPTRENRELVLFLAGLRHNGKRRYYSKSERKVSAAEGRRYDKRWEEIPEWADGTINSVCRMLSLDGYRTLDVYATWRYVSEVLYGTTRPSYPEKPIEEQLDLRESHVADAMESLDSMVKAFQSKRYAGRCLECWKSNKENDRQRAERTKASATVAT